MDGEAGADSTSRHAAMRRRWLLFGALLGGMLLLTASVFAIGKGVIVPPPALQGDAFQYALLAAAFGLFLLAKLVVLRCPACAQPVWPPRAWACPSCGVSLREGEGPAARMGEVDPDAAPLVVDLSALDRIDAYKWWAIRATLVLSAAAGAVLLGYGAGLAVALLGAGLVVIVGLLFFVFGLGQILEALAWFRHGKCPGCGTRFAGEAGLGLGEVTITHSVPAFCTGCGSPLVTTRG